MAVPQSGPITNKPFSAGDGANGFVLRPVNADLAPRPWPPGQFDLLGAFGAGQVAAVVAAVGYSPAEIVVQEDVGKQLDRIGALPVLVVFHREDVELVHVLG